MTVLVVTATGIGGYGMTLFSVHMAQHMVLSMLAPILLLMGAPVTLALRALPARGGGAGCRRALVSVIHSRPVRVLASPAVTLPLFIVSLYGLYYTPIFDVAMGSWWGHDLMLVHFLAVGLLLFWPILSIDPSPHRSSPVLRIIELFLAMPFHAFFGIAVMMSSTLLVNSFAHPPPSWHLRPLGDQQVGGGIAWAFSEIPTLLVVAAVFVQWARSSERAGRRHDRAADRDGGGQLAAYNGWLAELTAREGKLR
jgi:cytochrome c oxidase assembly factor CtaG